MKKNALIFIVLALLALVPVTVTFFSSGDEPESVSASVDEDEEAVVAEGPTKEGPAPSRSSSSRQPAAAPRASAASAYEKVPVFPGFEAARYQQYDRLISKLVAEFNGRRGDWCGGTEEQAARVGTLTAAQVKAHMIQETGGGDVVSRAAWAKDPLQVNVPGDWNPYKSYLGIRKPRKRNEGSLEKNLKAGIMLLVRKGFGKSGQPAGNQPTGSFDGWRTSLRRYNGRTDKAADGRAYSEAYADRILKRATSRKAEVPIPIPTKKR